MSSSPVLVIYVGISDVITMNVRDLLNISDVIHSTVSLFIDLYSKEQWCNNYEQNYFV